MRKLLLISSMMKCYELQIFILLLTIFFFGESFNLLRPLLMLALHLQTNVSIGFWYRQGLNFKSFIQLLEILLIELTGTHYYLPSLLAKITH